MNNINPNMRNILSNTIQQKNNSKINNFEKKFTDVEDLKNEKELLNACKEFEAIFTNILLKEMRSTVPEQGLTEKSTGRQIFQEMYDQEISKKMSQTNGGLGLAKTLYNQLKNKI